MLLALWAWLEPAPNAAVASTPTSASAPSPPITRLFTVSSLSEVESDACRSRGYSLLLPPARPVRERELGQGLGPDLDAVARRRRREVAAAGDPDRVDEVLVQVVDELAHAVIERGADRDEVEHRNVLRVLAKADAAGVRADRHAELRGEQDDREHLVHTAEAAAVKLACVDRAQLQQLLEDDAVLDVLAGHDADGRDGVSNALVAEHVVGARRLLDPPRVDLRQAADRVDRLLDAPHLVRVEREPIRGADRVAHDLRAPQVALGIAAHLQLQVREAVGDRFARP